MADEPKRGGPALLDAMLNGETLKVAGAIIVPGAAAVIAAVILFMIYT